MNVCYQKDSSACWSGEAPNGELVCSRDVRPISQVFTTSCISLNKRARSDTKLLIVKTSKPVPMYVFQHPTSHPCHRGSINLMPSNVSSYTPSKNHRTLFFLFSMPAPLLETPSHTSNPSVFKNLLQLPSPPPHVCENPVLPLPSIISTQKSPEAQ